MNYRICDARDCEVGHLGMTDLGRGPRLFFRIVFDKRPHLLLLPSKPSDDHLDFLLIDISGGKRKALDLGPDFIFDFDPMHITLQDSKIARETGSLIMLGSELMIVALVESGAGFRDPCYCNIRQGLFSEFETGSAGEIKSWRLFLPSELPQQAAKLLVSWPAVNPAKPRAPP